MTLFLIPARAGSKRLPGKNKRLFCGLPLWMWSWATAQRVHGPNDCIIVSSDDPDIYGPAKTMPRPADLAKDDTTSAELVRRYQEAGDVMGHGDVVLLQPTSPTRPDSLVRQLIAHGGQVRSVTNGVPNGQCYVYRKGHEGWIDVETEKGHDIDTLEDFEAAERDMMRRFA